MAVLTLILVAASLAANAAPAASARAPSPVSVYVTYYGWYDNTPPGCATAYAGCAGGDGSYAHPITFASDVKEFPVGTVLYYPTIEKYVVMGDSCQECSLDWRGDGPNGGPRLHHLDIWIGGHGGNAFDVINCEDALTQALPDGAPLLTPFIRHPPANEPVSPPPLFDATTNQCIGHATSSATHGRYRNALTGRCLAGPSSGAHAGAPASVAPCSAASRENLAFEGAFIVADHLCLQIAGPGVGSPLDWATCNGGPRQQWSINPNHTITWIQYTRCVALAGGRVKLAACTTSAADRWSFTAEPAP
ncbi:MAG: ricin-type beta-trefoil lectin domain protein [Acidimicrobiales bacterium]